MIGWRNLDGPYQDRLNAMRGMAPHEILAVSPDCSKAEARAAYLSLVKTYHPDQADPFMAAHGQEMLKLINQAYEQIARDAD